MRDLLRRVVGGLRRVVRRGRVAPARPVVRLDDVRRRLELLLAALYERPVRIETAAPPDPPGLFRRVLERWPAHLRDPTPVAWAEGGTLHLPPELALHGAEAAEALARYRLLALGQMQRLVRGTAAAAPSDRFPMERDVYLLLESAAVDAALAERAPGLLPEMRAERAATLAARPPLEAMTGTEREVERLLRRLLAADPLDPPPELEPAPTPAGSLRRARELRARLQRASAYRGLAPVAAWGTVPVCPVGKREAIGLAPQPEIPVIRSGSREADETDEGKPRDPRNRGASARPGEGPPPSPADVPPEDGAEPPPEGSPEAEPAPEGQEWEGGESPSTSPQAVRVRAETPGSAPVAPAERGIDYPEWDWREARYRRPGATVVPAEAAEGDERWSTAVLRANPALVRRTRHQFERLRARRARLYRQRDGEELDLEAWTRAYADLRTGHPVDDRLYADVRPARREISILLLVDISGSTDSVVGNARIIDVEKVALLLTAEALDALGDRYAVLTFSGERAEHVRVREIKGFAEPNGRTFRARVAALRPEGYTRLGAAVRHATALLARQGTAHQLLLLLSDGKPNDSDGYDGRYGIEDCRQAIAEARNLGVFPYCLTVDAKGAEYLPRIFGAGHVVLRHPEQLPQALLRVIEQMLRG